MSRVEILSALEDNYIFLYRYEEKKAFVVDPGDADPVLEYVSENGIEVTTVFNTHYHFDHVDGNEKLKQVTSCEIIGPESSRIPSLDRALSGDEIISLGPVNIHVIPTPGHTENDVCYFMERVDEVPVLWTGDTLFVGGCGRLFGGGAKALYDSLNRLAALPDETLVYCSHEYGADNYRFALTIVPDNETIRARHRQLMGLREQGLPSVPSSIGQEKETNIFLLTDDKQVKDSLGAGYSSSFERFAELRRLKDQFR